MFNYDIVIFFTNVDGSNIIFFIYEVLYTLVLFLSNGDVELM